MLFHNFPEFQILVFKIQNTVVCSYIHSLFLLHLKNLLICDHKRKSILVTHQMSKKSRYHESIVVITSLWSKEVMEIAPTITTAMRCLKSLDRHISKQKHIYKSYSNVNFILNFLISYNMKSELSLFYWYMFQKILLANNSLTSEFVFK